MKAVQSQEGCKLYVLNMEIGSRMSKELMGKKGDADSFCFLYNLVHCIFTGPSTIFLNSGHTSIGCKVNFYWSTCSDY